jgi:diguanylate cyclase (GGDEF)-like protein/PAS domain S-box-containing protein
MFSKKMEPDNWIATALAAVVLCVGLVFALATYDQRATEHRQAMQNEFEDTARHYAFTVQRQFDAYFASSQTLAAHVATSGAIDSKRFLAFIADAHYFEQLAGLTSLGYLPRVVPQNAAAFERQTGREFPEFKIRERRAEGDAYFPLLYGVHAGGERIFDSLRGIDFSNIPSRLAAIRAAEAGNKAAVTPLVPALLDGTPTLFTFIPVRTLGEAADNDAHGMVYAAMNVHALFEHIDNGRISRMFDVEVRNPSTGRTYTIFGSDKGSDAVAPRHRVYAQTLRYADQAWRLDFFPKPEYLDARADRHGLPGLITGILLSICAAYATFALARRYLRRRGSDEFETRLDHFFDGHPFAVFAMDRERRLLFVNQRMTAALGLGRDELIGLPIERFVDPSHRASAKANFRDVLRGQAVAYQTASVNAAGAVSEIAVVLIPITVNGEVTRVLGFSENITERKRFERELYESRQKLQVILDTVPLRVFWKDRNCVYLGANRPLLDEAGLDSVEQLVGLTDHDLHWRVDAEDYRSDDQLVMDSGVARHNAQWSFLAKDGCTNWVEVSKVPLTDDSGTVVGLLGVTRDITESKRMEAELILRANHDSLTGLPNRSFFYSELQRAIQRASRQGKLALLYFDIDRFKSINDTYGHDAGDEVIRIFARRARAVLREADFAARLGGDEFVVIVEGLGLRADAAAVADKLVAAMQPAFEFGEHALVVTTSIGIAFLEAGMAADQLVKAADDAMYEAKRAGRNCYRGAPLTLV